MPIVTGPWVWRSETLGERDTLRTVEWWEPPQGYGGLDIRKIPEQSQKGGTPGLGLFWGEGSLPSEYAVLGDDWDALAARAAKDAMSQAAGNALLDGHTLREALWSLLTDHADPDGFDAPCPLLPGLDRLELHCGQQLYGEQFRFGSHPHTDLVIAIAQRSIARYHAEDPPHARRILDKMCEDLRIPKDRASFQRLVPTAIRGEITALLPHHTTWSETWPNSESITQDTTSSDQNQPWTALVRQVIVTGASGAALNGTNVDGMARCETALSSANHKIATGHSATSTVTSRHSGPAVRYDASANTCYFASLAGGGSGNGTFRPAKLVAGTPTLLGTGSTQSQTATRNCSISGSTLAIGINGTETESISDGSISAGVRCGMVWINNAANIHRCTAATAEDLVVSGETVAPDDSHHGHHSTEATILTLQAVQPDDSWHDQHSTEAGVSQEHLVAPDDSWHAQWSDEATLLQANAVAPDDSWHVQTSDQASIAQAGTVSPDDSWHAHTSTEAGVTTVHIVAPDDSWHQQWADEVTVSQDVPGPIVVPNVAWQHWGPMLLMMDDGAGAPIAVGLSIRFHGAVVLQKVNANAVVLQTTRARSLVL